MLGRLWAPLGLCAALAAAVVATPLAAQSPRIVAIGDLHGDHAAWQAIARDAQLVDARGRWAGKTTVLVQTGDIADRGPDTLKIIRDLMRLQREAPRAGGRVVALVGNHEAMNIIGDLRYVSAGEFAAFADGGSKRRREQVFEANRPAIAAAYRQDDPSMTDAAIRQRWEAATPPGFLEHRAAWRPDGEIGKWVIGNPAVLVVDRVLFVHGGLSPAYAGWSPEDINRGVAAALTAVETGDAAIINDPLGPLWYRGLARGNGERDGGEAAERAGGVAALSVEAELEGVLKAQGVDQLVIGHTPALTGIVLAHDGRLARIDTGISAGYGGTVSYLEIIDGRLVPHVLPRPPPKAAGAR